MIKISVEDQGIGMTAQETENVFKLFWRAGNALSRSHNPSGNGIGLSICKKICQSQDGDMWLQSRLGEGSIFTFTMKGFFENRNESDKIGTSLEQRISGWLQEELKYDRQIQLFSVIEPENFEE